jgi:RNA polymerase sigma factor (sigma-70 family)
VPSSDRALSEAAWDAALDSAHLSDLLAPDDQPSEAEIASGLSQLNRYLSRAWFRGGIAVQLQDDCTQAVFETLLQNMGRPGFDRLAGEVGRHGVREVLNRDTADGPDFFRAVDMVKKRAQRERSHQPLDERVAELAAVSGTDGASESATWRGALNDAIDHHLNAREASLIRDTLLGKSPAEIASSWGVAPKTVSNEKTRAIHKLREALTAELDD